MKTCILGNAQSPHIRRWAKFFHERGHEVTIVSSRPHKMNDVPVYTPSFPFERALRKEETFDVDRTPDLGVYLSYVLLALRIRPILKRLNPDIVMSMTMETNGIISLIAGHHPTALYHLGCKALSIKSETSLLVRLLIKAMIRSADMLYTGDSAGAARLRELGADPEKIFINPWGIELEALPDPARVATLRRRLAPVGSEIVTCIRVFLPEYDVATFLRAVPGIARARPRARFVVVGDGPERHNLQRLAADLGISDSVSFVGYVPYEELTTYLAASDVYVDPVHYPLPEGRTWWGHRMRCSMDGNGYSITLLMALATGCVPLVTRRRGLSDIFTPQELRDLLWTPGDHRDLAQKGVRLMEREQELRKTRKRLMALARRRFDWRSNALAVEREYLQAINGTE